MKGKKSDSGRTKTTYQTKDKQVTVPDTQPNQRNEELGNLVPGIQVIVQPDVEKGAPVPGIQPIAKPDVGTQPVADVQPADNRQPVPVVQPEAISQPEPSGPDSSE